MGSLLRARAQDAIRYDMFISQEYRNSLEIRGYVRRSGTPKSLRLSLPIREQDEAVQTVRGSIRVPTVIVAVNYAKVPKKRPKLCARAIRERDTNRCQYTGRILQPEEGSLDHIQLRSRGSQGS